VHDDSIMLSVIIPIYNSAKFLDDCFMSVLSQSKNQNFEIVAVDDGSEDNSFTICQNYCNRFPTVFFAFQKVNEGQLAARLFGAGKARGEYVLFLDSDDMLRENAISLLVSTIKIYNSDLVIFQGTRDIANPKPWPDIPLPDKQLLNKLDLYKVLCEGNKLNNVVLKVFRREYCSTGENVRKYFTIRNGEDFIQSIDIINKAKRIVFIKEMLYYYRPNIHSITYKFQRSMHSSIKSIGEYLFSQVAFWEKETKNNQLKDLAYKRVARSYAYVIKNIAASNEPVYEKKNLLNEISTDYLFQEIIKLDLWTILHYKKVVWIYLMSKKQIWLLLLCGRLYTVWAKLNKNR